LERKMKKESKEIVVQALPHRCPYCDQIISYDQFDLKAGENPVQCPSCQKTFIRIVPEPLEEGERK
jgi:hypothetical protein